MPRQGFRLHDGTVRAIDGDYQNYAEASRGTVSLTEERVAAEGTGLSVS